MWEDARNLLIRVSMSPPVLDGGSLRYAVYVEASPHGDPWITVHTGLGEAKRLSSPKAPNEETQTQDETSHLVCGMLCEARPYVRGLLLDPRCSLRVNNHYLWEILYEMLESHPHYSLRCFVFSRKLFTKRALKFLGHAQGAVRKSQHVTADVEVGVRPRCYACHMSSHVSKAMSWFQTTCTAPGESAAGAAITSINEQIAAAQMIIRQLA